MNTKRLVSSILFCVLTGTLSAQLCWKITVPGKAAPSYLFGTHHLVDPHSIPHFDSLIALCQAVELFIGELPDDPQGAQKMLEAVSMPDRSLKALLSMDEYTLVDSEIKRMLDVELSMFDQVKPLYIGTLYTMVAHLKALGIKDQQDAVDILLRKKAVEKGLPAIGLETMDQQIDLLFNSITLERQAELLVEAVKDTSNTSLKVGQLNHAYLAGDLEMMAKFGNEDDWSPEEKQLMIDGRNLNWARLLPDYLNRQSCFIAVGCLHLVGETGLINQLRLSGFLIEPVRF